MKEFARLLRKKVDRLFLVVWPPWGEENEFDIDISFGFVFKNEPIELCVISVDKDELWLPHTYYQPLPKSDYTWEDFYPRIKMWMKAEDNNCTIDKEYYDVTTCELFERIIGYEISGIEFISVEGNPQPFGVRILFEDDYIISIPNSDGNTVETKAFNKNDGLEKFKHLGKIVFSKV